MRTEEALRRHYEIERELADRLRAAPRDERGAAYAAVYDELFRRVPDHPQLVPEPGHEEWWVGGQMKLLDRLHHPGETFLEVGAGDCALSIAMARRASHVYAVDVSQEIVAKDALPGNVELILSDGCSIPVPEGSVDVAYSNQLMEHLHPDDAYEQLENLARALRPGGRYVCVTPHRYSGPHDISRHFDDEATGFHLREYTTTELSDLLHRAGFSSVRSIVTVHGHSRTISERVPRAIEARLEKLSPERRRKAARSPLRKLLGVAVVATR